MRLSVIIPCYNRPDDLRRLLISLVPQIDSETEIIVIDQSDHPITLTDFSFVNLIRQLPPGLPAARNRGVHESTGDIVLFLDDDTELLPGCIAAHRTLHARHKNALIAGRTVLVGAEQWAAIDQPSYIDPVTAETKANFDLPDFSPSSYATGGHFSVPRSLFMIVKGFDARLRGNALYEDVDFSLRVRKAKGSVLYTPDAAVKNYSASSGGCHAAPTTRHLLDRIHNTMLFAARHQRPFHLFAMIRQMKNIAEFLSRKTNGSHSVFLIINSIYSLAQGVFHGLLPVKSRVSP